MALYTEGRGGEGEGEGRGKGAPQVTLINTYTKCSTSQFYIVGVASEGDTWS